MPRVILYLACTFVSVTSSILTNVERITIFIRIFVGSVEWIAARGSICSVMSASGHSFIYGDADDDTVEEEEVIFECKFCVPISFILYYYFNFFISGIFQIINSVSSWQLLKLNAPEWPHLLTGSIAAFIQGACFPVFAILLAYTTAVRNNTYIFDALHLTKVYQPISLQMSNLE